MSKELIKLNKKGGVQICLTSNQAPLIKPVIQEMLVAIGYAIMSSGGNKPLTLRNSALMIQAHLLKEIYNKYYAQLDHAEYGIKMTWTRAQAINFWECVSLYEGAVYIHPVLNAFIYYLHQKLS